MHYKFLSTKLFFKLYKDIYLLYYKISSKYSYYSNKKETNQDICGSGAPLTITVKVTSNVSVTSVSVSFCSNDGVMVYSASTSFFSTLYLEIKYQ